MKKAKAIDILTKTYLLHFISLQQGYGHPQLVLTCSSDSVEEELLNHNMFKAICTFI